MTKDIKMQGFALAMQIGGSCLMFGLMVGKHTTEVYYFPFFGVGFVMSMWGAWTYWTNND